MEITIKRLYFNEEIAMLNQYNDPIIYEDENVEHGQFVQFLQSIPEEQRDNVCILAAFDSHVIVGYIAAWFNSIPPFIAHTWVLNVSSKNMDASNRLSKEIDIWSYEKGAQKIVGYTRREEALRAFFKFGYKNTGWLVEKKL